MKEHAKQSLNSRYLNELETGIGKMISSVRIRSAWRVEGTLREYPKFEPLNMWFKYPIHKVDYSGLLKDIEPEGNTPSWQKAINKRKDPDKKKQERKEALETAFEALDDGTNQVTVYDLAEYLGVTSRTIWTRIKEHGGFKTKRVDGEKESYVIKK